MISLLLRVALFVVGAEWFIRRLREAFPPSPPPSAPPPPPPPPVAPVPTSHTDLEIVYAELARYDAMAGIVFQAGLATCAGATALAAVVHDPPALPWVLGIGAAFIGGVSAYAALALRYRPRDRPSVTPQKALRKKRRQTLVVAGVVVPSIYLLIVISVGTYVFG